MLLETRSFTVFTRTYHQTSLWHSRMQFTYPFCKVHLSGNIPLMTSCYSILYYTILSFSYSLKPKVNKKNIKIQFIQHRKHTVPQSQKLIRKCCLGNNHCFTCKSYKTHKCQNAKCLDFKEGSIYIYHFPLKGQ
jgi:hypothetical protein